MQTALPGEVAWYATGRFYVADNGSIRDVGYFLHLKGVEGSLFHGEPGEATAHFTFASEPFRARALGNGDLRLTLDSVGDFRLFFNPRPSATFEDPRTFARGQEIARFRRTSVVAGVALEDEGSPRFSMNVFSATPVSASELEFGGCHHDFGKRLPHGVTQWGTAGGRPLPPPPGFTSVVPFLGSAIAIGT